MGNISKNRIKKSSGAIIAKKVVIKGDVHLSNRRNILSDKKAAEANSYSRSKVEHSQDNNDLPPPNTPKQFTHLKNQDWKSVALIAALLFLCLSVSSSPLWIYARIGTSSELQNLAIIISGFISSILVLLGVKIGISSRLLK